MNEKLRQQMISEELAGLELWQVFDKSFDVDHAKCLEILLRNKADPNIDVSQFTPLKPFPIFHALKNLNMTEKLLSVNTLSFYFVCIVW